MNFNLLSGSRELVHVFLESRKEESYREDGLSVVRGDPAGVLPMDSGDQATTGLVQGGAGGGG